ncbi:MAG: hypothetical protein M2R45_04079 [Verrucomicrobia subdivision 3 bacterium]|nr:hypothetical protein [Limisphaerales bacterium]MCS1417018.1 hypothetical protein [Limisphaerales bacterium]
MKKKQTLSLKDDYDSTGRISYEGLAFHLEHYATKGDFEKEFKELEKRISKAKSKILWAIIFAALSVVVSLVAFIFKDYLLNLFQKIS